MIIEDNGTVAYAYFLEDSSKIISDVWLYNRAVTPNTPCWTDFENAPFLNSSYYLKDDLEYIVIPSDVKEFSTYWIEKSDKKILIGISINNIIIAILSNYSKIGWSQLIKHDGPLANSMTKELLDINFLKIGTKGARL